MRQKRLFLGFLMITLLLAGCSNNNTDKVLHATQDNVTVKNIEFTHYDPKAGQMMDFTFIRGDVEISKSKYDINVIFFDLQFYKQNKLIATVECNATNIKVGTPGSFAGETDLFFDREDIDNVKIVNIVFKEAMVK